MKCWANAKYRTHLCSHLILVYKMRKPFTPFYVYLRCLQTSYVPYITWQWLVAIVCLKATWQYLTTQLIRRISNVALPIGVVNLCKIKLKSRRHDHSVSVERALKKWCYTIQYLLETVSCFTCWYKTHEKNFILYKIAKTYASLSRTTKTSQRKSITSQAR